MNAHMTSGRWSRGIAFGTALVLIAALSSCNLTKPSAEPTQTPGAYATAEPTQTPGTYATAEQSLKGKGKTSGGPDKYETGKQCPPPGVVDYLNLCFNHQINFVMANGMGFTVTPYTGSNCVLLELTSGGVTVVGSDTTHGSAGFKIDGTWNFANTTCTLTGQTLLKVSVYGRGEPPCRDTDKLFLTVFESWDPAPIHAECKPVQAREGFHSTPVDVTVPMLEDRGTDLTFFPVASEERREGTAGSFSAVFLYKVMVAPGVPSSPGK